MVPQKDWNNHSPALVEKEQNNTPGVHIYRASKSMAAIHSCVITMFKPFKALAERAAWEFVEKNKDNINFDLVTILPPFVSSAFVGDSRVHVDGLLAIGVWRECPVSVVWYLIDTE